MSMDSTSIASLYAAEHARLRQLLVRRGMSAQTAADVVHEAFVRLLRSQNDDVRDLRSYLHRTARTVAVDLHRKEQRAARVIDPSATVDETIADPLPRADATLISREEIATLAAAIQELPPRTREVLTLHRFEGLSYGEISERLGIAKNTVMVHMVKGLGLLKSRLRENNSQQD